jgi:predicted transcriptional regulator
LIQLDYLSPIRSELKLKILLKLLSGDKRISELRLDAETRDTTILHVLEEFGDLNLTTKTQGLHKLTPLGIIEAISLKEFILTTEVVEKFKEFWLSHNVDDIPAHLIQNLGALKDSQLVRAQASELGIVHQTFMETMKSSKKIKGYISHISPRLHILVWTNA